MFVAVFERVGWVMDNNIKQIIVHDGTFHADDVICVAILRMVNPSVIVRRLSLTCLPENEDDTTIIADIGFGEYDHHQVDAKCRSDGKKHAACGLILTEFEYNLFPNGAPTEFLEWICQIEDNDNKDVGSKEDLISEYVRLNNPEWNEDQSVDNYYDSFMEVVEVIINLFITPYITYPQLSTDNYSFFVEQVKKLRIKHMEAELTAREFVIKAYEESNRYVVVLDKRLPWYNILIETEAQFVINPSNRGGYHLQCIPSKVGSNEFKLLLPSSWINTPPNGCSFVHRKLFIAAFSDLNYAIDAANDVIKIRNV